MKVASISGVATAAMARTLSKPSRPEENSADSNGRSAR